MRVIFASLVLKGKRQEGNEVEGKEEGRNKKIKATNNFLTYIG